MSINVGSTIRVLRNAKGLKLKDVAKQAGISNPFLTLVEQGAREPSLAVIKKLAVVLSVPVDVVLMASQPADTCMRSTNERAQRIVESLKQLGEAERSLRDFLEATDDLV